jgi:hypothetical protein
MAVLGIDGAVDHDEITRMDSGPDHGVALHTQEVSGLLALHQELIEVQAVLDVVVRRRGKAGRDVATEQGKQDPAGRLGRQQERRVHRYFRKLPVTTP